MPVARITGEVLRTDRRRGTSQAGNPYDMTAARILVAHRDVTEVTYSTDNPERFALTEGDLVDLLVDLTVYRGEAACRVIGDYPETDAA